jgi:hypothetical protein
VPADIPETAPEVALIVATAGVLLAQLPPAVALVSVKLAPTQPDVVPNIAVGVAFTVTMVVT